MRKIFSIAALLLLFSISCSAQYRINKEIYDTCKYVFQAGDPFNPTAMGLSSALIPGLGQIIEGENLRGLCFLGGSLSLAVIKRVVVFNRHLSLTFQDVIRQSNRIGQIGLRVWSAINAVRVAKINNLAFRDKYNSSVSIKILPFPDLDDQYGLSGTNPAGLTLIVTF